MKSLTKWLVKVGLLLIATSASAAGNKINVMTLNQYLGADLTPLLTAGSAAEFNAALVKVLEHTAQSDFPARAIAQAKAINKRSPDVLALQESGSLSCLDYNEFDNKGCEDPQIINAFHDYLDLTKMALNQKKPKYKQAALVKNLDTAPGIPFVINGVWAFLTVVDRDVILVREGIDASPVTFPCSKRSEDGCNYQDVAPLGPFAVERGFVGIDTTVFGKDYRIINTHLEIDLRDLGPFIPPLQAFQARELIDTITATKPADRVSLLLGDINSSPEQTDFSQAVLTPYHQFTESAHYLDAWDFKRGNSPGYTCCQPEDLKNRRSALFERIDMIFLIEEPEKVKSIQVIGNKYSDKTKPRRTGLWPSDHGAVTAKLKY
ncbi:MAG: endonuclease/exonuclease/phosphatase family protein [Gammaproteobacteria bacterium]